MKRALLLLIPLWLLMCILTFSCAGPNQPDDNIYVTNVMVTKWYNIHEGAISITHDYGPVNSDQSQAVLIEVLDRGLTIDYEFLSAPQHIWNSKATFINEFCIPNNIQFFGHGHLHNDHDALSYDEVVTSFSLCKGVMESLGLKVVAAAYPFGRGHEEETRLGLAAAGFLSGRRHHPGDRTDPYILANEESVPEDWFALPTLVMQDINFNNLETAVNDTEELIPFLDETLAKNAWLITTYHAIGHTDSTYGFYTMDNFISDLEEIEARDFWVASMNDVTLYIYERNLAVISDSILIGPNGVEEIQIRVEDDLDDTLFSQPLTIELDVPEEWVGANIEIISDTTETRQVHPNHTKLYFNTIPNGEITRLVKVDVANKDITNNL